MKQCMDADNLHRRLKKIIGQVQAIDRMVDEDVPCEDILSQINAAKSALHKCGQIVLASSTATPTRPFRNSLRPWSGLPTWAENSPIRTSCISSFPFWASPSSSDRGKSIPKGGAFLLFRFAQ